MMRLDPLVRISIKNVIKLLENPIKDFIDIQKIPFFFGDENGIYEVFNGKKQTNFDFKNLQCKPSKYTFIKDRILYFSRIPYLRFFNQKHNITLENRSIFNDSSNYQNFALNSKYIYISQGAFIKVFTIKDGTYKTVLSGHKGLIYSMDCDEDKVLTVAKDKKIRLWYLISKNTYHSSVLSETEDHINLIRVNDKMVVGSSLDNFNIYGFNLQGKNTFSFSGHKAEITDILFYNDLIISSSKDSTIRLSSITTGQLYRVLNGHLEEVSCLHIIDDMLLSGSKDKTIRFWNLKNGSCIGQFTNHNPILTFPKKLNEPKETKNIENNKKCIGLIICGHCKKFILVCIHKDEKNGIPYCEPVDHLKEDDFCQESNPSFNFKKL